MSEQANPTPPHDDWHNDDAISVPVRIEEHLEQTDEMIERLRREERDTARMVEEYEARYGSAIDYEADETVPPDQGSSVRYAPLAEDMPRKKKKSGGWWGKLRAAFDLPPRHRYAARPLGDGSTDSERQWAAIAHASAILTLVAAMGSVTFILPMLIPLGTYFYWRKKSDFVAFHALQAFTMQVVGTIGFLALLLSGSLLLSVLIVLTSITIVGLPVALVLVLVLVLFIPATLILPLGMLVYGIIAAFATQRGRNFRYPWIADWVDDQLANGLPGIRV